MNFVLNPTPSRALPYSGSNGATQGCHRSCGARISTQTSSSPNRAESVDAPGR